MVIPSVGLAIFLYHKARLRLGDLRSMGGSQIHRAEL